MSIPSSRLNLVGQTYQDFKVTKAIEIPELQCFLRELVHEPSGAQIMHIENEDPENLFCLSFQTLPYNSNGVAHILEHTVLCGSRKFPVKDPFFAMNRRSLNTFMNALTGADFTCYPAATQVPKDFYNLLEVYLDAVFHPILHELSFLQEGHRFEFSQSDNSETPLEYKGIVYNEMKGALSSANARLAEAINETLFPSITYGYNSGGEPKNIPQLSYEELKQFYQVYYHPSRCLFFFYGNMPLEDHLDFIADQTLNQTTPVLPLPPIPLQPRFKAPVYRTLSYPIAADENSEGKTLIAFGWLTCHILDQQDALALGILDIILMDTDASLLKRALLKSGLCKQAHSFMDVEIQEIPWGIVLKGCQPEDADALENVLKQTLTEIGETGISCEMIENAIHQIEFFRTEITGDHAPVGLSLFMRSGLLKQHGAEPTQSLRIHSLFKSLRQTVADNPHYFSDLIKKYLLENTHFTRIIMLPDPLLGEKEAYEEKQALAQIKDSLSQEQKQEIIDKTEQLNHFQKEQEEEDFDVLPKVHLDDIDLVAKDYPLTQEKIGNLTVFQRTVFTNDIVYADLAFDLPYLPEDDLPYLRLLTVVFTQMGCGNRSSLENLEYIQGNTGGIGAGISLNVQAHDHSLFYPTFHLRGKALHRKAANFFSLMHETLTSVDLSDSRRLKEVIVKHFTGMEGRLNQSSLKYAINLSASGLNVASKIANDLYGLNYYWKIRELVKNFDDQASFILAKLQEIQQKVTCLEGGHLILSCQDEMYQELKQQKFYGLQDIPARAYDKWSSDYALTPVEPQGRVIASPVAFISKVFSTVSYTHPDAPALNIASFLFDNLTLHAKIREQGGAYGGGAMSNPLAGNFYFYSYRDPNVLSTLKAFEEAVYHILQGKFDDEDLESAKFEMIQNLDAPLSPGSQGEVAYGWLREGRTFEVRQAFREKLLSLTADDIIEAVEKHILIQVEQGIPVIFAGRELLEKANQQLVAKNQKPFLIEGI